MTQGEDRPACGGPVDDLEIDVVDSELLQAPFNLRDGVLPGPPAVATSERSLPCTRDPQLIRIARNANGRRPMIADVLRRSFLLRQLDDVESTLRELAAESGPDDDVA